MLLASGCVHVEHAALTNKPSAPANVIALFSTNPPEGIPQGWAPLVIFHDRKQTRYNLVEDQGRVVLHAAGVASSSGLLQYVKIDPLSQPWINWRWKVGEFVKKSGMNASAAEDSPARIVLGFDGDKSTLSFSDQVLFETAKMFTGYDFPYATLMYVWDSNAPIGTIIPSRRSGRIKRLVVANRDGGSAKWQSFNRNMVEDFERAFGEKPGALIGVGVLTDSDYSGGKAEAWYGDIYLQSQQEHNGREELTDTH